MSKLSKQDFLSTEWQIRAWKRAVLAAGPRYTKEFNVNLPIADLFDGVAKNDAYFNRIISFKKQIEHEMYFFQNAKKKYSNNVIIAARLKALKSISKSSIKRISKIEENRSKRTHDFNAIIKTLEQTDPTKDPFFDFLREKESQDYEQWKQKNANNQKELDFGYSASDEVRELQALNNNIRKLVQVLASLRTFLAGNITKLVNYPFLLILGKAGVGKTHLLCDIAKNRIDDRKPTFIVLGEELTKVDEPLSNILRSLQIQADPDDFLAQLNKEGERIKERVLIIIDALNEGDKEGWKRKMKQLVAKISKYPWIGVVFSCRVPFENITIPKNLDLIREQHMGFEELELEAMKIFFKFYQLPLPEVPLLVPEFSNPLFLGSFCKTARDIKDGKKAVAKKLKELAMGQKGMTTILEDFYRAKQILILKKYAKSRGFNKILHDGWLWKHGECVAKLLAEAMAKKRENYLERKEVLIILGSYFNQPADSLIERFLKILLEFGVLIEDLAWNSLDQKYFKIIKFSFHKFSDHLIARYLLNTYLIPAQAKKCIKEDAYLGPLFKDEYSVNKHADLIEALFVEFPERLKGLEKYKDKDLIDYLDSDLASSHTIREIYVRSLYWRSPSNFFNAKHELKKSIRTYLNEVILRYDHSRSEFLNLFITTSLKPLHALNANKLDQVLRGYGMQQRDIFWSEFIRKQYSSSSIHRLLDWLEHGEIKNIDPQQAEACITTLAWLLTTTNRHLRDRATRCLYLVGRIHPRICFDVSIKFLSCNDPYVSERVLGAAYGVCLATHNTESDHAEIFNFAKTLFQNFFQRNAPYATTHILTREYAKSVIELGLWHNSQLLDADELKRIQPPYSLGKKFKWGRSPDKDKGKYRDGNSPLGMDFENYSIGRLVKDRHNYDFKNKEYIKVKENILWRIYQLGYSFEIFGDIDKEIARSNSYYGSREDSWQKTDRYGKKYSLIAYFEMAGYRLDKGLLETAFFDRDGRGEDDIDPSFPAFKNEEKPIRVDFLKKSSQLKKWLINGEKPKIKDNLVVEKLGEHPGPWVLVDGYIAQVDKNRERKINLFINGMFIEDADVSNIKKILASKKFPGNDTIPNLPEVRNMFAGELDWREAHFKMHLHDSVAVQKVIGYKKIKNNILLTFFGERPKKQPKYWKQPIYQNTSVIVPGRYFHTKDYSSNEYENIGIYIPNASIVSLLNLETRPDTQDLSCPDNSIGTISICFGDPYGTHQNLLFIRKDLLAKLEDLYKKSFHWFVWGEKNFWPENMDNFHRSDLSEIYQSYKNIHRQWIDFKNL